MFVWVFGSVTVVAWLPVILIAVSLDSVPTGWLAWGLILASGVFHLIYSVLLQVGYQKGDLSVVYPVARGTGPLLSAVIAILLLNEPLTVKGMGAIALIVLGIFCIAGGKKLLLVSELKVRLGLYFGAATGAFIACYTVIDGYAVKVAMISPILLDYMGNVLRWAFMTPHAIQKRVEVRRIVQEKWRYALAIGIIAPLPYVLVLYAMQEALVSQVAAARELSMVVAAWLGIKLLNEGQLALRLLGSLLIVGGVVLLALS